MSSRHGLVPWGCVVVLGVALCGCATVPSGHGGVLFTPGHGVDPEPLGEGVHVVGPLSRVDVYDLRAQEQSEDLVGLSADGALLFARASLVTYHLPAAELPAFVREVGPDYYRSLIVPVVRSTVRRVLGAHRSDELGTAGLRSAQDEITRLAAERLRVHHVVLDSVFLRGVFVVSSEVYAKVLETGTLEQKSLEAPQQRALARSRASAREEAARGVASAHRAVEPTLTPAVLADLERRAWERVLTAPSTTIELRSSAQPTQTEIRP